ncbi:hypothetical protein V8E51_017712 [Hyaloscypha variabilis]
MIGSTLVAALGLVAANYASPIAVQDTSAATEGWLTGGLIRETRNSSELQGSVSTSDCPRGKDPDGNCCPTNSQRTNGDGADWGLQITNGDNRNAQNLYVYMNQCDSVPLKYITLAAGDTKFVSLPHNFQGRVTRGTDALNLQGQSQWLGTWFECSFDPSPARQERQFSENWCLSQVQGKAYCDDSHGSPVIVSKNSVFDVTFYAGYI